MTYAITNEIDSFTVDKASAAAGETVTITNVGSSASNTYAHKTGDTSTVVMQVTVISAGGTATFTMPDYAVTIASNVYSGGDN